MCYAYSCRKAQRKPLHEMLSMKLPAETFWLVPIAKKTRTKETGNCLFLLAGDWGNAPKIKESSETRNKLKCKF